MKCLVDGARPLEDRPEPRRGLRQLLGQHARLADDGHEVGVAVPARNDVEVQVIEDAGAGRLAEVDADVDAVRRVRLGQCHFRVAASARSARTSSSAVASASVAMWRFGTTIRWPLL